MELPTLEEAVDQLKAVTGLDEFDPDVPLPRSDVDSLDLVEWLYEFQELHTSVVVDESVLEDVDDTVTFRHIHDRIIQGHLAAVPSAGAGV